jgi:hypothetical protein
MQTETLAANGHLRAILSSAADDLTMARKLLLPYRQRVIGGAAGCSLKPHRPDAEDRP